MPVGDKKSKSERNDAGKSTEASGQADEKKKTSAKKAAFGGTSKRDLRQDIGEGSPGPGAYLPGSTFARAASPSRSGKKGSRDASSSFRSGSAQRPRPLNEHVPGAGAYTPHWSSIEPAARNPGNSIKSKDKRGSDTTRKSSSSETGKIGPGEYDSHYHKSVTESITKSVKANSRSNPGFGRGSARKLPYEESIEADLKPFKNLTDEQQRKMDEQDKVMADLAAARRAAGTSSSNSAPRQSAPIAAV
mmetsp:Transcript_28896/g.58148  ORF Transcript_28896/g.58148 Transcript_28896/m.58148 type:complete len:247 (-) Transcript_28896:140-880(-)|eukprot:CAMPEP_0174729676 /NCGR_PEP_ID=MMETSP1094-20130205/54146_1 /TAXON_ID=156173 /ORGANISM="Chrysochromulina brevifilum, Strain UTEX LB 985" /LENGTH=246 /DNA_ID=CAMNT_0015931821 /DNA_START=77 /DNA_END=817 /DNA_ORIENTATION=+